MAKDNVTDHWTFTMPGAMIRGAMVCLFLLFIKALFHQSTFSSKRLFIKSSHSWIIH
jgi:hypothetical protein